MACLAQSPHSIATISWKLSPSGRRVPRKVTESFKRFLEEATAYVAIATVCDVVPLVDENRILAHYGLRSLAATKHPGLRALLAVAKIDAGTADAEDVAFRVGPRINASGHPSQFRRSCRGRRPCAECRARTTRASHGSAR